MTPKIRPNPGQGTPRRAAAWLRPLRGRNRRCSEAGPAVAAGEDGAAKPANSPFAGEEAKLIRTLSLLQILLLVSTLTVAFNYGSAEDALQAYESAALRDALDVAAPQGFSITLEGDAADAPRDVQRLRLEGAGVGSLSVRRAAALMAANAAHRGLATPARRRFSFEVHDAALGVDLRYTGSTLARDVWTFDGPKDAPPLWTALCAPLSDVNMVLVDKAGRAAVATLPLVEMSFRVFFRAELTPASLLARPDLARWLAWYGSTLAESQSQAQMMGDAVQRHPDLAKMPADQLKDVSDPCRMVDLLGFAKPGVAGAPDERLDLVRALGRWKGATASVQTDYVKLRDARTSQEVKVPLIDVSVPARGFAWAVMILTLYVGVTLSRLARALESAGHPTVTTVAQIPLTLTPASRRSEALVTRLEHAFPWLNALAVALAPLTVAVASAVLWVPLHQTLEMRSASGGEAQLNFLPIRYLLPYVILLVLAAVVTWVSVSALRRERKGLLLASQRGGAVAWTAPAPPDAGTDPSVAERQWRSGGWLGPLRSFTALLDACRPTSLLAVNAVLGLVALTYYGDLALEDMLRRDIAFASATPLLVPKLILVGVLTATGALALRFKDWWRAALAVHGLALLGAWAWGMLIAWSVLVHGRLPLGLGPPWTFFIWIFGVLTFLGTYGAWLLTRSLRKAGQRRLGAWLRRAPWVVLLATLPLDLAVLVLGLGGPS